MVILGTTPALVHRALMYQDIEVVIILGPPPALVHRAVMCYGRLHPESAETDVVAQSNVVDRLVDGISPASQTNPAWDWCIGL